MFHKRESKMKILNLSPKQTKTLLFESKTETLSEKPPKPNAKEKPPKTKCKLKKNFKKNPENQM